MKILSKKTFFLIATTVLSVLTLNASAATPQTPQPKPEKHYYIRVNKTMSWHAAVRFCENLQNQKYGNAVRELKDKAYLATVNSQAEQNYVYQTYVKDKLGILVPEAVDQHNNRGVAGVWLGGTDEVAEHTWQWINGERVAYKNFPAWEDNNYYEPLNGITLNLPLVGFGEDYLMMMGDGSWNDSLTVNIGGFNYVAVLPLCEFNNNGTANDAVTLLNKKKITYLYDKNGFTSLVAPFVTEPY